MQGGKQKRQLEKWKTKEKSKRGRKGRNIPTYIQRERERSMITNVQL